MIVNGRDYEIMSANTPEINGKATLEEYHAKN